jgi:hypothetical protein
MPQPGTNNIENFPGVFEVISLPGSFDQVRLMNVHHHTPFPNSLWVGHSQTFQNPICSTEIIDKIFHFI